MSTRDQTVFFYIIHSTFYEKSKFLNSERSIVTRLKLKEIDERALQSMKSTA